ncbi:MULTISPECIES: DUF6882 domain-containing protein [Chryseobacterium]|uniref:DUF6882 domain-containing protein n=1 Tax=Chryseobacterium TaxID=59732 RepID=UPI001E5D28C2|nr:MULTISPECIES: DUF6882 domain-containing protein [Chryseobacterium]MDR6921946.1 hypothetical protein [Chryseobacterium sp. 2987]
MTMLDYNEFAQSELNELIPIQEEFINKYNINSFTNWFYDSDSQILRLYNNDHDEIFFKYIPIGTYSLTSETWMWSWFNNYLTENNKSETLKIKDFGQENSFKKLYEGTFSSDKFDSDEFIAISFKILRGIGVYIASTEKLNFYLLLTEIIEADNNPEIKMLKQKKMDCGNHGFKRPAYVCQHLNLETPVGFEEAFDTYKGMELDDEEDFQAWCNDCEKIRIKYDGWDEESEKFAKIKLVCEDCYFEMKKLNNL